MLAVNRKAYRSKQSDSSAEMWKDHLDQILTNGTQHQPVEHTEINNRLHYYIIMKRENNSETQ